MAKIIGNALKNAEEKLYFIEWRTRLTLAVHLITPTLEKVNDISIGV